MSRNAGDSGKNVASRYSTQNHIIVTANLRLIPALSTIVVRLHRITTGSARRVKMLLLNALDLHKILDLASLANIPLKETLWFEKKNRGWHLIVKSRAHIQLFKYHSF